MIRRINLFAGPGAGKSTVAAYLFSELKIMNFNIELVPEYVKIWTYISRSPKSWDQLYLFSKQLHKEDLFLDGKVNLIVSESPLYLNNIYARIYNLPGKEEMISMADKFEAQYPSINVFLERENIGYSNIGRYHSLEEAENIDNEIKSFLKEKGIQTHYISTENKEDVLKIVLQELANG